MKFKMDDVQSVVRQSDRFKISWKMTDWCNYRCSYCYMKDAVKKDKNTPIATVLDIASHIDELAVQAKGRNIELHLIGGEVSYYNLQNVLDKITTPLLKTVLIATNFSRPLDYWKKLDAYCKKRRISLRVIASFHLEQCDKEEFVKKAIDLGCSVKCVVNSKNINEYKPYFNRLMIAGNKIEVTIERDNLNACEQFTGDDLRYVDSINNNMKKKGCYYYVVKLKDGTEIPFGSNIEMINSVEGGMFTPCGFICTAGIDGLRINQKGDLLRAACTWCSSKFGNGKCGNLLTGFTLPSEPIVCNCLKIPTEKVDENGNKTGQPDWENTRAKGCTCFCNNSMFRRQSF